MVYSQGQKWKIWGTIFLLALSSMIDQAVASDIDTRGLAEPPFLSMGADSNLLLLLDNSGSMLDMAYTEVVGNCVDNSYDMSTEYAGLYNASSWYTWVEGTQQWASGTIYTVGDIVYSEGVFYRAIGVTGVSDGYRIDDDKGASWTQLNQHVFWEQGETYSAKSFVLVDGQLYYTATGGTANDPDASDGITVDGDTGVNWTKVDSTLINGESYSVDDVVSFESKLFRATTTVNGDETNFWTDVSAGKWQRLDEGYFEEVSGWTSVMDAKSQYDLKDGDYYIREDLYIKIVDVSGVDSGVTAFAAKGNILNWASASKFDIQKDVLTGGKYDENLQQLIGQSRGCSSRRFFRELEVYPSAGIPKILTIAIEGAQTDTQVDTNDETTRIVIRGLSDSGFIDSARQQACQDAIDSIAAGYDDGLGTTKKNIDTCMAYSGTNNVLAESNAAYNHSIHSCWEKVTKEYTTPADFGNVNEVINSCQHIYDNGVLPVTIDPEESGYVCSGVYNKLIPDAKIPTGSGSDRIGYVGRCWETGVLPLDCEPTPCLGATLTSRQKCFDDGNIYECPVNLKKDGSCIKEWSMVLKDNGDGDADVCDTSASIAPGKWTDDNNPNDAQACIQEGLWDYCQNVTVPQVIDPSDETFDTGTTYGMVGALIDGGVTSMFEHDHALIVMKSYIKTSTQPEGLIHKYSSVLRMGAMAFRDNGAETECANVDVNDMVEEYCPADNKDGAELISPIRLGTLVTDDNGTPADSSDDIQHMDELASAINDVRATAWTPLAEAYYAALGYYGQDSSRRLFDGDLVIDADFLTEAEGGADDPIEYWCQSNFILVITEGASTADVNDEVRNFVDVTIAGMGSSDSTEDSSTDAECLADDGTSSLYGSTYLDDLTYFGQNGNVSDIYTTPQMQDEDGEYYDKQNISTFIVTTGSLQDDGTDSECNPKTIMENAANNGGSELVAGEKPEDLEANLLEIFKSIRQRASAGSAASVVSSSRGGEGAVYQAIFWPELTRDDDANETHVVEWAGDVRGLLIDSNGHLFDDSGAPYRTLYTEDKNGNGYLDAGEDSNGNGTLDGDRRVIVYYDSIAKRSRACYNESIFITGTCDNGADLEDVAFLWSAGDWLAQTTLDTATQRSDHVSNDLQRKIFTWNDLNNDGIVDSGEWLDFVDDDSLTDWKSLNLTVASNRSSLYTDFDVDRGTEAEELAKIKDIIGWVRGRDRLNASDIDGDPLTADEPAQRSRYIPESDGSSNGITWRLGDVIYSTPMAISAPAEGYHLLYNDFSYAKFLDKWQRRRHVIYYGANDGMLHAVNGGFYIEGDKKFCLNLDASDPRVCDDSNPMGNWPQLGAELWAYVPYNILPHLRGLTETDYKHKYFVDLRPRIFDVQIFEPDSDHVDGWGTILVGGMRLGGSPINANDLDGAIPGDGREFISSYFILDITNPEKEPTLLAELTRFFQEPYFDANTNGVIEAGEYLDLNGDGTWNPEEEYLGDFNNNGIVEAGEYNDANGDGDWDEDVHVDLGHSTNISTMVIMKEDGASPNATNNQWYLMIGSGPRGSDAMKGVSDQEGKMAVIPLEWLVSTFNSPTTKALRIPNEDPTSSSDYGGRFLLPDLPGKLASEKAFLSDAITLDYDINPSSTNYMSDTVYLGSVEGEFVTDAYGVNNWTGGGKFYRLITRDTYSFGSGITQNITTPEDWYMTVLMDVDRPITTAPSVGYDGYNFWFYAGSGRFFDADDKHDDTQHAYFGIKEPMQFVSGHYQFNWPVSPDQEPIPAPDLDSNLARPDIPDQFPDDTASPGLKGLLRVDEIEVLESTHIDFAYLSCDVLNDGRTGDDCLPYSLRNPTPSNPASARTLGNLAEYIAGKGGATDPSYSQSADGWYKEFYPEHNDRQRNLGQPTLLGGLLLFTAYQPYEGLCQAEGLSYLYGVYYVTGTSWHEEVFGDSSTDAYGNVENQLFLGQGLSETPNLFVGEGSDGEMSAYVQTSTGEVKGIDIENVPVDNYFTGRMRWKNCGP